MNLKKAYNILLFWVIVFSILFLLILVFAEFNVINDNVFSIVFIVIIFLLFSSLALIDKICCKLGKKIYYSDLIDKQVRKRLLDYFVKENFTCKKYGDNENIILYENREREGFKFRTFVIDLKFKKNGSLSSQLQYLFDDVMEDASKSLYDPDGYLRNFVFLITDELDEKKFKVLDDYTLLNPNSRSFAFEEFYGNFLIPVVLCIKDKCVYFPTAKCNAVFYEARKLDMLKLFEIDSK